MSTSPSAVEALLSGIHGLLESVQEAGPELVPGSEPYGAASLLLALRDSRHSVDHLAARLGLKREFVARCMRRLVDNGVVRGGTLSCAWETEPMNVQALIADVNVALGRWIRREGPDGSTRWAPSGAWRKEYEYTRASTASETRNTYHVVPWTGERWAAYAAPTMREPVWIGEPPFDAEMPLRLVREAEPEPWRPGPDSEPGGPSSGGERTGWRDGKMSVVTEMILAPQTFPQAAWLY